jgi:WD40 repeat protein
VSYFVIALSFAAAWSVLTSVFGHEQECTLRGHSGSVTRVQFSDDGLQVISSSNDGTVLVSTILRPNPACQSCVLSLMISFAGLASVLTPLVPPDRCASGM